MNWPGIYLLWFLIMSAEVVHGICRTLFLVRHIGVRRSNQVGILSGSLIIFVFTWFCISWIGATSVAQWITVGAIWIAFTVLFEIVMGKWIFGFTWQRITAEFNLFQGNLMLLGLGFMGVCPLLVAWLRALSPFADG